MEVPVNHIAGRVKTVMEVVDPAVTSFCLWLGERDGNEIPPRILVPL